jgi:hypothetical protein
VASSLSILAVKVDAVDVVKHVVDKDVIDEEAVEDIVDVDMVDEDVVDENHPTGRARMCCRSTPTAEQRQATRGAGRLPERLASPGPSVNGPGSGTRPGFGICRACHLTYT